jgi:hypothetical protein
MLRLVHMYTSYRTTLLPPVNCLGDHLPQPIFGFTLWERLDGRKSLVRVIPCQGTSLLNPFALRDNISRLCHVRNCSERWMLLGFSRSHLPLRRRLLRQTSSQLMHRALGCSSRQIGEALWLNQAPNQLPPAFQVPSQ